LGILQKNFAGDGITPNALRRTADLECCLHSRRSILHGYLLRGHCLLRGVVRRGRDRISQSLGSTIAKNKNPSTFAKRQREQDKKRKASEKLQRRERRKSARDESSSAASVPGAHHDA
jgi:hypothetical protein